MYAPILNLRLVPAATRGVNPWCYELLHLPGAENFSELEFSTSSSPEKKNQCVNLFVFLFGVDGSFKLDACVSSFRILFQFHLQISKLIKFSFQHHTVKLKKHVFWFTFCWRCYQTEWGFNYGQINCHHYFMIGQPDTSSENLSRVSSIL